MHGYLGGALGWLVPAHVLASFLFVLLHLPSMVAMWRLRAEREPTRVARLLDTSRRASVAAGIALLALAVTGALLAATEHAWRAPWVWGSAVVLVGVSLSMSLLAARPFNHARSALGLRWFDGRRTQPATGRTDASALQAALVGIRSRAPVTLVVGGGALALLVWLMVARPG